MPLMAPSGGDFTLVPAGNHEAVIVGIIDLGIHTETYEEKTHDVRKVQLVWELTAKPKNDRENHPSQREAEQALVEYLRG